MKLRHAIISALLSIAVLGQAINPRPAHAVAGVIVLATGGPSAIPLLVTGGVSTIVGGGLILWGNVGDGGFLDTLFGFAFVLLGIVLLDDQSVVAVPAYQRLDEAAADRIGLSSIELEAYNDELDELNAQFQSVASELARKKKPTLEDSRRIWKTARLNFSPEAMSAYEKVSLHYHAKIYERIKNESK